VKVFDQNVILFSNCITEVDFFENTIFCNYLNLFNVSSQELLKLLVFAIHELSEVSNTL